MTGPFPSSFGGKWGMLCHLSASACQHQAVPCETVRHWSLLLMMLTVFHLSYAQITDQTWLPKDVKVPFLQVPFNVKGKFRFLPPDELSVVGSYLLGTCVKPEINVDVVVTMPRVSLDVKVPKQLGAYLSPHPFLFPVVLALCLNF